MREIKFRGKHIELGHFVVGDLLHGRDDRVFIDTSFNEVDPATIGQYTGLKDAFGHELFEGDIVKQEYELYQYDSYGDLDLIRAGYHLGQVAIIASQGVCMKKPLHYDGVSEKWSVSNQYKNVAGYRAKVIGNIHDNPELLKEANNE